MNIMAFLVPGYIDPETGNPVLSFHLMLRTSGGVRHEGDASVLLASWTLTPTQKKSLGQQAIRDYILQTWGLTVPGNATWDVYGV
jgi:hypothetical protein